MFAYNFKLEKVYNTYRATWENMCYKRFTLVRNTEQEIKDYLNRWGWVIK